MKCRYCEQEIKNGALSCPYCGKEVRIVPDYNPIEDELENGLKDMLNGNSPSTRLESDRDITGARLRRAQTNHRRQREEERLRKKKKKRKMILITVLLLIFVVGITTFFVYKNSYAGIVSAGNRALDAGSYETASSYFEKGIRINPDKAPAYSGMGKVYSKTDDLEAGEEMFLNAVEGREDNVDLYRAFINFYIENDWPDNIPYLLQDAEDNVRGKLSQYIVNPPEFSLSDETVFDEVQQVEITTDEDHMYYSTDGSKAGLASTPYVEAIQLNDEGETVVSAIAVNSDGIPSLPTTKTYTIQFPNMDAPSVSPSTGQYDTASQIEIKVPEGYTAYYTTDTSEPTLESTLYEGPIDMPEGSTIFKAVLADGKGRLSAITTRNYILNFE
ncbi:tetratricopeptide (TPR) repeat protein [Aequitasia blattaphilus]|uniref:Chitobiase/beta-hexosaminidase C-terminal domain-containing protein n=1 Tax=Aequitasia blattaphilus TaxID=2949332 RepID=A0ABT1E9K9_9FIRM|nr:chitobiase/beta-hexosaminidase C-terminal domain-containing protein [Aequitasia blattaphilus]MCP1101672.1 chitobiase/beta-hexosaminidase C-terminal domain-containing protein [Aequitasia blattaphilus]MCR8614312.1 chitobiase/beta-hexosaminidase C-terminal domain-containing protein [Aequitasia blattaphilus]